MRIFTLKLIWFLTAAASTLLLEPKILFFFLSELSFNHTYL